MIKTREEWEEIVLWCGDCHPLNEDLEKRNNNIQDLLIDALDAANRGGDFSTPIEEIVEKYGSIFADLYGEENEQ